MLSKPPIVRLGVGLTGAIIFGFSKANAALSGVEVAAVTIFSLDMAMGAGVEMGLLSARPAARWLRAATLPVIALATTVQHIQSEAGLIGATLTAVVATATCIAFHGHHATREALGSRPIPPPATCPDM